MARNTIAAAIFAYAALACFPATAQNNPAQFASDDDRLDGDHLTFRTNVYGFAPISDPDIKPKKCAPVGSKVGVGRDNGSQLWVRFYVVPDGKSAPTELRKAFDECPERDRVNTYTTYVIERKDLPSADYRRTGVTFGGLVVPFKFRLGGDNSITASSTIAPYVGFR